MSVTESTGTGRSGGEPPHPAPGGTAGGKTPATVTPTHLIGLGIVVLGILAVLALVMPRFNAERDTAAGILGIVIPAFATIGAALFGITIAYSEGKATGEQKGKAEGEAGKLEAVVDAESSGRKIAAREILARLEPGVEASDRVVSSIEAALVNPAGSTRYILPDQLNEQPLSIDAGDLAETRAGIREAVRRCQEILNS